MTVYYGLDIGGTKMEMAIYDANWTLLHEWRVSTPGGDYPQFLQQVQQLVAQADQWSGQHGMLGIALPGISDAQGLVISSNLPCLNQQPVADDLQALLTRPVVIENDCRSFVLSEARLGAGQDFNRVLGVILGTGCGGGFYADGQLQQGAQLLVGEFGHQSLAARVIQQHQLPLFRCGCGLLGCAETYVSGRGLERLYQHLQGNQASTYQWLEAYRAGEAAAQATFAVYMDALGAVLAAQILAYDPDIIVLGGGLSDIAEIIAAAPAAVRPHLFAGLEVPPIRAAAAGAASGKRGAALAGALHEH